MVSFTPRSSDRGHRKFVCIMHRIGFANLHGSLASTDDEETVGDAWVAEDEDEEGDDVQVPKVKESHCNA